MVYSELASNGNSGVRVTIAFNNYRAYKYYYSSGNNGMSIGGLGTAVINLDGSVSERYVKITPNSSSYCDSPGCTGNSTGECFCNN